MHITNFANLSIFIFILSSTRKTENSRCLFQSLKNCIIIESNRIQLYIYPTIYIYDVYI